jgi:ribosomal protein S18 acetylase RimI-like enzyme
MSVHIVDADETDIEDLITIYSSPHLYHNREEASWFVKSHFDYHHVKVAKHQDKVIGAIFWNVVEEKHHGLTEIRDFWIDENFRRRGFGEKLLRTTIEDMEQFFRKGGYVFRKALVTTGEDNEPAKKLYEKAGFRKVAVLPDLFAKGENELVYVLTLNPQKPTSVLARAAL